MLITYEQAVRNRLWVNHLSVRLPAGSYVDAAYVGLQDTAPRDALLGMHARVADCEPSAWEDPRLIQTYSPRAAVYVLPKQDFGVFTVGRMALDRATRSDLEALADRVCRDLAGQEVRAATMPGVRTACATGRIAVRWTTSALYVREVATEAPTLASAPPMRGVRLLALPDLRLFGQDRAGLFVGPGKATHSPLLDTFHPNGVLVDGWGGSSVSGAGAAARSTSRSRARCRRRPGRRCEPRRCHCRSPRPRSPSTSPSAESAGRRTK